MQSFHKDKVFRINSVESTSENTEEMKLLTVDAKANHACLVVLCVAGRSQKDPSIIILMDLREEEERLESVSFFFFYLDVCFSLPFMILRKFLKEWVGCSRTSQPPKP